MANALLIIALGVFAAGAVAGVIVVVSIGIRREERRFRELQRLREERFFQTGEVATSFLPEDAPDHLTGGARLLTGLWVRRRPQVAGQTADRDLFIQ